MAKILIVDDEPDLLSSVETLLKFKGYETFTASDGKECLAMIKKENPDLILLDIMMPGLSAIEVVSELEKKEYGNNHSIIIVSAVTMGGEEKSKLLDHHFIVDFVEKPFEMNDLLSRIEGALKK